MGQKYRRYIGVYKITNPIGQVYVGSSSDIKQRWRNHKSSKSKSIRRLNNSFIEYGVQSHLFDFLEICDCSLLKEKERYWQEKYNAIGELGLNSKYCSTNEQREVISYETKINLSKARKGIKRSKEFCEAISKRMKGVKKKNSVGRSKIVLDTVNGIYYDNTIDCSFCTGIGLHKLRQRLSGVTKNNTNYVFV